MPEIGATLREARMHARIDLSEIEAKTKIRARYLRALENEEWDVLPGPTFIKSFLRTYAEALGLDAKALVEEYRLHNEQPGEAELQPIVSTPRSAQQRPSGRRDGGDGDRLRVPSRGYALAIGAFVVVIALLIVGLLTHKSSNKEPEKHKQQNVATGHGHTHKHSQHPGTGPAGSGHQTTQSASRPGQVTLSLQATETVWICLVGEGERKLIPGVELQAGETSGPYHAKRFQMTLGNNDLTLTVDGRATSVPASTEALGFEITSAGRRKLAAASEPTCT
ncbi:MAG TPA: helix-turn-helix domain-containing protein [Solirubrobacteraceae bacterium]|jgi:cytoskeletal protein RodZ